MSLQKFGNPFIGNNFKITQTSHSFDNAIDAIGDTFDLYAVCDMQINGQEHDGKTPWFRGFCNGMEIRYVHSILNRAGLFTKGEKIGTYRVPNDPFPDHLHISVKYQGQWLNFMEYLDRGINLQLSSGFTNNQQFYKNWLTWSDKQLPFTNTNMQATTSQYSSLSLIARDLFKLPNWRDHEAWETVLKYNEHLRTGDYNNIPANEVINVPSLATVQSEDPRLTELNKELAETRKALQEGLVKQQELEKAAAERESVVKQNLTIELAAQKEHYEQKLEEVTNKLEAFLAPEEYKVDIGGIAEGIKDELKARGFKEWYHDFIDRTFKSSYFRSLFKYDYMSIIFVAATTYLALAERYSGENEFILGVLSLLGGLATQVIKFSATHVAKPKNTVDKVD